MKNVLMSVLFAMALPFTASAADQDWSCTLKFDGEISGIRILFGSSKFDAKGTLNCTDNEGNTENMNIGLRGKSRIFSPSIQIGAYKVKGETKAITLGNGQPSDLLGDYLTLKAGVAVPVGLNAFIAEHQDLEGLKLVFSINVTTGVGITAGISEFEIYEL